jgi:hypothetical protein
MNNPVYKFFFDELEENEIFRYSNGTIIEMRPSNPNLSEGFERIVKELESRGYRRMKGQTNRSCCFSKPEYCNAAFIGTTVNPFSFRDKIWCWTNQFAISKKYISIYEVYRHNGTSENSNFRIEVGVTKYDKAPVYCEMNWFPMEKINKWGIEVPTKYQTISQYNCTNTYNELIRKFKPTISDRVLKNIIDKADALIQTFEISDVKKFEADCSNFPKSNEIEYWKWRKETESKEIKFDI